MTDQFSSSEGRCTGVILAAGRGSRINPLSAIVPKPLLPICNKPIMQYHVEVMQQVGVTDLLFVVNRKHGLIRRHFGDGRRFGLRIRYVVDEQPQGIASSLALVEPLVGATFVAFLGDVFLDISDLRPALAMIDRPNVSAVLLVKREPNPQAIKRNFAVIPDEQGWVRRVAEKPRQVTNDLKGCGVYLFEPAIFDAIRQTARSPLRNEYELTDAIQTLIDMQRGVRSADLVRWDMNVTFPVDLLNANLFWLRRQGLRHLIGRNVRLAPGTALDDAIIGDEVEITHPVAISESVLFPGTRLKRSVRSVRRSLLLPELSLSLT